MAKKITIQLSEESIKAAIKEVARYKKWVDTKTKLLIEKLAIIGAQEASIRFASAMYDGVNDVSIEVGPTSTGWMISAKGEAVAFIEFGAGVYHNPGEPYPRPRPEGVVGIGEYGKGYGKRRAWGFYDETGKLIKTRGTPAAMPMWYATTEMQREVERIAKEVFGGG
jgi:hypothetical protein